MKPRVAVVDTNVVVAALVTSDVDSPTARILDGMLKGALTFLLSTELVAEYIAVLSRPRLKALHGLESEEIDTIMSAIAANGIFRSPSPFASDAPDPGDQHLWALLATEQGAVLITGDEALQSAPPPSSSVLSPRQFVELAGL